jgi:redox-sensitive bicupin YhaK (pirin superfamily)
MRTIRRSDDRGHADHGWLDARHSFSFAGYHDPDRMGYRSLRVINEDRVAPGAGFGSHPHRDMEILTFVIDGTLDHTDGIGGGHRQSLRYGEVQRISAGTGMVHSEFNGSASQPVHLLQVWIIPDRKGHQPRYEQREFRPEDRRGKLVAFAGPDTEAGTVGALPIHQDAWMLGAIVKAGQGAKRDLAPGRAAWAQVVSGDVTINGELLHRGDAIAIENEPVLEIVGASTGSTSESEVVVFDLA